MRFIACLLLAGLLSACATHSIKAPVGDRNQRPVEIPGVHTVKQGDTLYSVAFLYGREVEELARWNGLKPPYTIYKGQRLRLKPPAKSTTTTIQTVKTPPPRINPSRPKPRAVKPSAPKPAGKAVNASAPKVAATKAKRPSPASQRLTWKWPAGGKLLQRYKANAGGNKGINIAGGSGDKVKAAAAGKVVYSGSGLGGYGRLIIIKHNKEFLSAYAHNRKLIAKEGEWVRQGQVIARMGRSGTDRVQLHFEIRKRGRPVDPLRYLPRR